MEEQTAASREATEGGWTTVGNQKGRKAVKGQPGARNRTVPSPTQRERVSKENKNGGLKRKTARNKGRNGDDASSGKAGGGGAVYEQLRRYLREGAPKEYVGQTVLRLQALARDRRFAAYLKLLPPQCRKETAVDELRRGWTDAVPFRLREKHEGLTRVWEMDNPTHQDLLAQLLHQWTITDGEHQSEVEDRLRFIRVLPRKEKTMQEGSGASGSYLAAVTPDLTREAKQLTAEQIRLRELCLQRVPPTTKLRARTADETAAIVMVLNHEIEVPAVPPFLTQSMAPGELAVFEDLFKALEYSIYAHVAPGQRFFDNMTATAILAQIHCGVEAAPAHKSQIETFKRELSRIGLDMRTRVLKVTFKGRATAAKWVGWQVPLANKALTLVDYDMIRARATRTNELVMLDYYSFVVEVRKGTLSSRDMYWLLKEMLGLKVQAVQHTKTDGLAIQERQWQVRVCAEGCPPCLVDKSLVVLGDFEVAIHHAGAHVSWPCRTCLSPAHPTRFCTVATDDVNAERTKFSRQVEGTPPSVRGSTKTGVAAEGQPHSMAQLERILRAEGRARAVAATASTGALSTKVEEDPQTTPTRAATLSPSELQRQLPDAGTEAEVAETHAGKPTNSVHTTGVDEPGEHAHSTMGPMAKDVHNSGCSEGKGDEEGSRTDVRILETPDGTLTELGQSATTMETTGEGSTERAQAEAAVPLREGHRESLEDGSGGEFGGAKLSSMVTQTDLEYGVEENDYDMETVHEAGSLPSEHADAIKATNQKQRETLTVDKEAARGRSPTAKRLLTSSHGTSVESMASQTEATEHSERVAKWVRARGRRRKGARRASTSPKRRAERHWVPGRATDPALDGCDGLPGDMADIQARSLSPKRLHMETSGSRGGLKLQQFMHQFMVAVTGRTSVGDDPEARLEGTADSLASTTAEWQAPAPRENREDRGEGPTGTGATDEDPGFTLLGVSKPTDAGAPLGR